LTSKSGNFRPDNPGLFDQGIRQYAAWKAATGKEVVMVQEREPGKELFVDWMGDTLECVPDSETRKMVKAHFFVATFGDSGYSTVIAYP
jgi:transposase